MKIPVLGMEIGGSLFTEGPRLNPHPRKEKINCMAPYDNSALRICVSIGVLGGRGRCLVWLGCFFNCSKDLETTQGSINRPHPNKERCGHISNAGQLLKKKEWVCACC